MWGANARLLQEGQVKLPATRNLMSTTTTTTPITTTVNQSTFDGLAQAFASIDGLEDEYGYLYVRLSSTGYLLLALITAAGLLVSLMSNIIIIYIFSITPSLRRNPSNIIAVNLSLSDLLYCFQWPSVIYSSLTQSTELLDYEFVCQSFGFLTVSTAMASILTVLAMSVERAIVISYSIYAKRRFTIRGAWLIIVLIWAVAIASSVPPLFGKFNRYTLDPSKTSCTLDYSCGIVGKTHDHKVYILFLFVFYWIAPTVIIIISYASIIITFKKSSLSLREIGCSSARKCENSLDINTQRSSAATNFTWRMRQKFCNSTRLKNTWNGLKAYKEQDIGETMNQENAPETNGNQHVQIDVDCREESRTRQASDFSARRHTSETIELPEKFHENLARALQKDSRTSESCRLSSSSKFPVRVGSFKSTNRRTDVQFRLAKMSFYLILLWLVSWTPIAALAVLNSLLKCHKTSATAVFIAISMTKLGPAFDVLIYGISHPKIKSKFKQIFKWLFMFGSGIDFSMSRSNVSEKSRFVFGNNNSNNINRGSMRANLRRPAGGGCRRAADSPVDGL